VSNASRQTREIRLDSRIAKAIERTLRSQIVGIPVVDALHRTLADILSADDEEKPADAEIRKAISGQFDSCAGTENALVHVMVHDGIVELRGVVVKQDQHETLRSIAENVPGVKAVHDHLMWIDVDSKVFQASPEDSASSIGER
jgi:hypothetical protein